MSNLRQLIAKMDTIAENIQPTAPVRTVASPIKGRSSIFQGLEEAQPKIKLLPGETPRQAIDRVQAAQVPPEGKPEVWRTNPERGSKPAVWQNPRTGEISTNPPSTDVAKPNAPAPKEPVTPAKTRPVSNPLGNVRPGEPGLGEPLGRTGDRPFTPPPEPARVPLGTGQKLGVGGILAAIPGNIGQNYPFPRGGPLAGSEINPKTGVAWTKSDLEQYNKDPKGYVKTPNKYAQPSSVVTSKPTPDSNSSTEPKPSAPMTKADPNLDQPKVNFKTGDVIPDDYPFAVTDKKGNVYFPGQRIGDTGEKPKQEPSKPELSKPTNKPELVKQTPKPTPSQEPSTPSKLEPPRVQRPKVEPVVVEPPKPTPAPIKPQEPPKPTPAPIKPQEPAKSDSDINDIARKKDQENKAKADADAARAKADAEAKARADSATKPNSPPSTNNSQVGLNIPTQSVPGQQTQVSPPSSPVKNPTQYPVTTSGTGTVPGPGGQGGGQGGLGGGSGTGSGSNGDIYDFLKKNKAIRETYSNKIFKHFENFVKNYK